MRLTGKFLFAAALCFGLACQAHAAWDETKPTNTGLLKDAPAEIRANWDAIMLGTDTDLQITNAKVSASAAIVDTKLATISTAGKVSGAALTSLTSVPAGAGALPIANGGTGSATKNFIDLTTAQTAAGIKRFSNNVYFDSNVGIGMTNPTTALYVNGVITGNGSALTNLVASNLASGTVPSARLGDGSALTGLNAASLASGTVPTARLGTGTPSASTFLRGDNSWVTPLSVKVGYITKTMTDASGDTAYTGVGFQPKAIIFFAASTVYGTSQGFSDVTSNMCTHDLGTLATKTVVTTMCIKLDDGSERQTAIVKSFDADGFTLTWTKFATPGATVNITYLALG